MAHIIVFTKPASLNSVFESFARRPDIMLLTLGNPTLQFDEERGVFRSVQTLDNEGLFLAHDGMSEQVLGSLLTGKNRDNLYILKHTKPEFALNSIPISQIAVGRHAANGEFYSDMVRILGDSQGNKVGRIFESIFRTDPILEAKLALLQNILRGDTPTVVDNRIKNFQERLDTFSRSTKTIDVFSTEFQQAFEKLRDGFGIE